MPRSVHPPAPHCSPGAISSALRWASRNPSGLLRHELLVNCVATKVPTTPFVTSADLPRRRALRLISECPCQTGCPSCVQSPKCGNLNEPLNKRGAVEMLSRMAER